MSAVTQSPEEAMVQKVLDLLKELLEQDEKYLITNQSMHKLISLYESELLMAIHNGSGASLIDTWKRDIPQFRHAWLYSPFAESVVLRGRPAKTATESATHDAHADCTMRKQGTKGGSTGSKGGPQGPRSPPSRPPPSRVR